MLPLIVGVEGTRLSECEVELFSRMQPVGYILFSRNIEDYEETRELTDALRRLTTGAYEPIIALDQEGGRVIRTAAIGIQLPSAAALGALADADWVEQAALYSSRCLHTLGVNTVLAPVLDYSSDRANALGGRCWGDDSQTVISYAGVWNRVMQRSGILTCGKHFPGMGEAQQDPHFSLPRLTTTREEILAENGSAIPFTALMGELPSIMVAHPVIMEMDAEHPASLSPVVIGEFLRRQLGYDGLVFTDDLCMGAITESYGVPEAMALSLKAGCDVPLVCHNVTPDLLEEVAQVFSTLPKEVLQASNERVERFRVLIPSPLPPMSFIEWREYVSDVRVFCSRVEEKAQEGEWSASPVQRY